MNSLLIGSLMVLSLLASCEKRPDPTEPPTPAFSRYSKDITLQSTILGASVKYSVYLPENYVADSTTRYPVVYLLHGYGDDNNAWNDEWLRVSSLINYLEANGKITPMIYVMPQGFKTYYVNRYTGTYNYMDMFVEELVPQIDKTLRTISDRSHRAVVGYSMGGYGALIIPSKHPELFSVSVPLSMSFRTDAQYITEPASGWDYQWGYVFGGQGKSGCDRLTEYYKQHNPFYYFTPETAASFSNLHFFLSCGDDEEQLLIANDTLHVQMRTLGISHEFRVKDGAHTSAYWRNATSEALPFIQGCFNGEAYREEETLTIEEKTLEKKTFAVGDGTATLYYPESYQADQTHSALYLLYEEPEAEFETKAVSLLAETLKNTQSVLITCSVDDLGDLSVAELLSLSQNEFSTNGKNFGIGILEGGHILYEARDADLKALYLIEASIEADIAAPDPNTFYFFSLSDESRFYRGADALYQMVKRGGLNYQYRVYNGVESSTSILYGLSDMISSINEQTK